MQFYEELRARHCFAFPPERLARVDGCRLHCLGRRAARGLFAACRWIIDEVKLRVPIWERERYVDGDAGWLHPEVGASSESGSI